VSGQPHALAAFRACYFLHVKNFYVEYLSGMLLSIYHLTLCSMSEDFNLQHHCCETSGHASLGCNKFY